MEIKFKVVAGEDFFYTIIKDVEYQIDRDGYLIYFKKWTREFMEVSIKKMKLGEITDDHIRIVDFARRYWEETCRHPTLLIIIKAMGFNLVHIYNLFSINPCDEIYKAAGLPPK